MIREEVFDDRRRGSRVYAELARGVAGSEGSVGLPKLAVGDGALGFWSALEDLSGHPSPALLAQENVLNALLGTAESQRGLAMRSGWLRLEPMHNLINSSMPGQVSESD